MKPCSNSLNGYAFRIVGISLNVNTDLGERER